MKKAIAFFVSAIMFVTIFTACGANNSSETTTTKKETTTEKAIGKMQSGSWNGKTFTNKWSNISITIPKGYSALTEEEMKQVLGVGKDIVLNGTDKLSEKDFEAAKGITLYDFMIKLPDSASSLSLGYVNASGLPSSYTSKDYLKDIKGTLTDLTTASFTYKSSSTGTIAGEKYDTMSFTVSQSNVTLYQTYYVRKYGKNMMFFISTYLPEKESEMNSFLNSITKA